MSSRSLADAMVKPVLNLFAPSSLGAALAGNTATATCVPHSVILSVFTSTLSPLIIPHSFLRSFTSSSLVLRRSTTLMCTVVLFMSADTSVASLKAASSFSATSLTRIFLSNSMSIRPTLIYLIPVARSIVFIAAIILLCVSIRSRPSSTLIRIAFTAYALPPFVNKNTGGLWPLGPPPFPPSFDRTLTFRISIPLSLYKPSMAFDQRHIVMSA